MKRRDFSKGLAATTLTGTAVGFPRQLLAGDEGGGRDERDRPKRRDRLPPLALIVLAIFAQEIILSGFAIANQGGFLGLSLRKPVPQFPANRVSVSKLPILGSLFRPTIPQLLSGAVLVGFLVLVGTLLIMVPRKNKKIRKVKKVIIVHKDVSYEPKAAPRPVNIENIPKIGALFKRKRVGDAYQDGENLIVLVRPTIVDGDY